MALLIEQATGKAIGPVRDADRPAAAAPGQEQGLDVRSSAQRVLTPAAEEAAA